MKKIFAIAAATAMALSVAGISTPASAGDGGAVAAGVIGGLAVGAIVGSQAQRGYAEPSYGYGYEPRYRYSRCHTERQEVADYYGNYRIRRVRVCD